MDSMTQWNSCKLPKPTTFLLVASVRISHPQQFPYILFNLHRELDIQVSNLRSALLCHAKCASQFLSAGGIWTEKSPSLSIWHYWVLISRGCPGRDQDLNEMGTVQKQNKNAGLGLALVMLLSCCLCFKKNISLQIETTEMGVLKKKKSNILQNTQVVTYSFLTILHLSQG